jgi:hypothetical protein
MDNFGFQSSSSSSGTGISGSGTTNFISKFTGASAIGDSQIFDDGTNVGINNNTPTAKLDIKGIDALSSNFALKISNSTPTTLFSIRNDGLFIFNGIIDGASSGNNNFEYKTITGSTRSAYYGATGLETFFDFYTNAVKNTSINEFSGYYAIIPKNRFSIKTFNDGNTHFWMDGIANGFIGIGDNYFVPTAQTHIRGIDSTLSNFALKVENSAITNLLSVRNDGFITINGNTLGAAKLEINGGSYQGIYSNSNVIGLNGTGLANGSIGIACSVQSGFAGTSLYIRSYDVSNKLIDIINSSTNPISRMLDSGYFGIGTISPTAMVHSKGIDATSSNYALKVENSTPTNLLSVRNDGVVDIYGTITPRLQSIVSSATVTPTNLNDEVVITAQATGLTLVNPTGTAVQGQSMIIRIKDNGTARTIAYDTQYRAIGVTLPTTTVINKIVYLGLIYNSTDTKWDVIGVSQEA